MYRKPFLIAMSLSMYAQADLMQDEIEHVVVLMMENRSFDNVLAWLYEKNVPNYFIPEETDPNFKGLSEDTLSQYANVLKDDSGQVVFSSPPIKGVPSVANTPFLNSPSTDPNEYFPEVTNQIFNGGSIPSMSGFVQDYASNWDQSEWQNAKLDICAVMETYTEKELPVFYGLAKHYAVSDMWFSSIPSCTNPNRAFAASGTSEGQVINGSMGKSLFLGDTIWNRLSEESPDTSWMIFWSNNMIPNIIMGPFTASNTFASLLRIPHLDDHFSGIDRFHDLARKGELPDFTFIEPLWTLTETPIPHDYLLKFFSYNPDDVDGLQGNDFHPPGDMRPGENLLANVYTSLIANPEAWKKTLLIITFDEHGGLFDHVPPPVAVAPDNHFENGFQFDRYGVRIPTIFISPKIAKSGVIRSSDPNIPFDHTSLIATILKWKNVDKAKWNLGKRTDAAPTFEQLVTLTEGREDTVLKPDSLILPEVDDQNVVRMGDKFYLKNQDGEYLTHSRFLFTHDPRVGSAGDRVVFSFVGGAGDVTHGSFLVIQILEAALGDSNVLGTSFWHTDGVYASNSHDPSQWWTVKSLDCPYVGAKIQYGDRVYLENHTFLDPSQYLPARLSVDKTLLFGDFLQTLPIHKANEGEYWIFEKAG